MTPGNSRPLPYSPRRRTGSTSSDDDDMISNLPDSILQHILSFLPTKNAVATGVLSQSVELGAPSLVYIKLEDVISSIFILESLSSLVEANINLAAVESRHEHDYCNLFVEAFRAFHCAETLTLSSHVIWALSCAAIDLKTRFKRLSKLEVKIGPCCWSSLQEFIELSDNLEVLTVKKEACCMNEDHHSSSKWKNPNQVPSCLSNSLETFSFDAYDGSDDQLAMVGYILKHGNALKVVQIGINRSSNDRKKEYKLVQQISKLPMKSTVCEVEFC